MADSAAATSLVGGYGSCTFAFQAEADDELSLSPGDIVRVISQEDADWQKGELVCTAQQGIYPVEFVTPLETARARDDYQSSEKGDLTFLRGDSIVLTARVDKDWVKGVLPAAPSMEGIFPRDFVDILGPGATAPPQPYAQCTFEFRGEASDELTIFPEDVVYLLYKLSDEWYEGICFGQRGIVPASFLDIIEDAPLKPTATPDAAPTVDHPTTSGPSTSQASAPAAAATPPPPLPGMGKPRPPSALSPPKPPPPSKKSKPTLLATTKKPLPPSKATKKPGLPPTPTSTKRLSGTSSGGGAVFKRQSQPTVSTKPLPPPKAKRASAPSGSGSGAGTTKAPPSTTATPPPTLPTAPTPPSAIPPKPATAPPPAPTTVLPNKPKPPPPPAKPRPPVPVNASAALVAAPRAPDGSGDADRSQTSPPKPVPPPPQQKPTLTPMVSGPGTAATPPAVGASVSGAAVRVVVDEGTGAEPFAAPPPLVVVRKPRPQPPSRRASNVMTPKRRSHVLKGAAPTAGNTLSVVQPSTSAPPQRPRSIANRSGLPPVTDTPDAPADDGVEELEQQIEALELEVEQAAEKHMGLNALLAHMHESADFDDTARTATTDQIATAQQQVEDLEGKLVHLYSKRSKRAKIVAEIFDTEQDLSRDLRLCVLGYLAADSPLRKVLSEAEFDKLFCNMEELAGVADELAEDVRRESLKPEAEQVLGRVFCQRATQLQDTYVKYVVNFDDATELLNEVNGNPRVKERLQRCHASVAATTKCWDLGSFLIKPVQRILKYPLLLRELAKKTTESHVDYADIQRAETLLSNIATAINEGRRTKEILEKYSATGDGRRTRNPHGLMHTLSKKSIRMKQRVTRRSNAGEYEEYNDYVKTFTDLEAACKKLRKRCDEYLTYKITTALALSDYSNAVFEFFFSKDYRVGEVFPPEARRKSTQLICDTLKRIEKHTHTYVDTVRKLVLTPKGPLDRLLQGFANPQRLIAKRADKQLDYESFKRKYQAAARDEERQRSMKAEMGVVENTFQALHLKLMTDLPMAIQLYQQALGALLRILVDAHASLARSCLAECARVPQQTFGGVASAPGVEAALRAALVPVVQGLLDKQRAYTFRDLALDVAGPAGLTPSRRTSATSAGSTASSRGGGSGARTPAPRGVPEPSTQRAGEDEVGADTPDATPESPFGNAVCRWEFEAMSETEVSVAQGDNVVIVSRSDDTGNSEWYLVQTRDGRSGFVPADFLDEEIDNDEDEESSLAVDDTEPDDELPPLVVDVLGTANVLYDFEAGAEIELTVTQGDVCEVLAMMDPSGNEEWCLLRHTSGVEGYVPVNFISVALND